MFAHKLESALGL